MDDILWWCNDRPDYDRPFDPVQDEPVTVWLERALACVGDDGVVDRPALLGVGFAHDVVLARRFVSGRAGKHWAQVEGVWSKTGPVFRVEVLGETYLNEAPADFLVPATRAWCWTNESLPVICSGDDVVSGLVALAMLAMPVSIHAHSIGCTDCWGCRCCSILGVDTWAPRIAHALTSRTNALTPLGAVREIALARFLLDYLAGDIPLPAMTAELAEDENEKNSDHKQPSDSTLAPLFGPLLPREVADDAASVYKRAIEAWAKNDLEVHVDRFGWGEAHDCNDIPTPPYLGVIGGLCAFLTATQRFLDFSTTDRARC
jgi:hypothetical protein